jgi:hypothetical protein
MLKPPYIFIKDMINSYKTYKLCNVTNKQFIECMNNYILKNKNENCNIYYDILKKNKCI